ncbi:hypothetical protein BHM03_00016625 [Ensete ventricosum]|nr:hypothetical protein BHM03_00016625 [Ensete ventricosum]
MVVEMLTTRRGSGFRRAKGSGEEEEVGARQAAGSDEGCLQLRWLQREEDEEGTAGGDCGNKGAGAATTEAQMRCGSRKRRRRYCASTGKKELAAAAKQRRQRGRIAGSGSRRVVAATGGDEAVEEEGGCARVEQRPTRVWLRLWLRRKEEGSDSPTRAAVVGEKKTGWMRCGSRKRRRRHCAPTGKKELAAATKQRKQRGSSGSREEWQVAAYDGWQRRQVRSREEGEKQGRGGDRVGVCDRGLQAAVRRRLRQWVAAAAVGDGRDGRR